MTRPGRYPQEVRERAVRLVLEHRHDYASQWAAISSIAAKCGMTAECWTSAKWDGFGNREIWPVRAALIDLSASCDGPGLQLLPALWDLLPSARQHVRRCHVYQRLVGPVGALKFIVTARPTPSRTFMHVTQTT